MGGDFKDMKIKITNFQNYNIRQYDVNIRLMQPDMILSQLMVIDGIERAYVAQYHASVTKASLFDWDDIEPQIIAKLGAKADTEIIRA